MKKSLAILLTVAMVLSLATTVLATLPVPGDIVGVGQVPGVTIPGPLFAGTIPTTGTLNFIIDPYDLLGLDETDIFDGEVQTNAVRFGTAPEFDSPILRASNYSTVPTILTVDLAVTNTAGNANPVDVTVVSTESAVAPGINTDRNVLFWLEPTRNRHAAAATGDFVAIGQVVPFGTNASPSSIYFNFEEVPSRLRVIDDDPLALARERVDDGVVNGSAFTFGGMFNHNADWTSAAAGNVQVRIRTTFNLVQQYEGATWADPQFVEVPVYPVPSPGPSPSPGAPVPSPVPDMVVYGLLAGGENATANDSGPVPVPVLIPRPETFDDPEDAPEPVLAGFVVGVDVVPTRGELSVPRNTWGIVPFDAGDSEIVRIENAAGVAIPQGLAAGTTWAINVATGNPAIRIASAFNADLTIVLENGSRFTFRFIAT